MKTVHVFAVPTNSGEYFGYAVCAGHGIVASHLSSSLGWVEHDMGISSDWKHDAYDRILGKDIWEINYHGEASRDDVLKFMEEQEIPVTQDKDAACFSVSIS